jgi:hypothetical protein
MSQPEKLANPEAAAAGATVRHDIRRLFIGSGSSDSSRSQPIIDRILAASEARRYYFRQGGGPYSKAA